MQAVVSSRSQIVFPLSPERSNAFPGTTPVPIRVTPGSAARTGETEQTEKTSTVHTTSQRYLMIRSFPRDDDDRRNLADGLEVCRDGPVTAAWRGLAGSARQAAFRRACLASRSRLG